MFDVGFPELVLFGLVVLLVLGPERLPQAMRALGSWYARMRYLAGRLRQDLERELEVPEELQQIKTTIDETVSITKQSLKPPGSEQDTDRGGT